ncbi:MAG: ABC transporter permease [Mariniblastus sp.]
MGDRGTGLLKIAGITTLLLLLWCILIWESPLSFLTPNNLENLLRRTALYGVLGIGVAFVIISSGIDLSIGSLVCLAACLLALFLHVDYVPVGQVDVWQVRADASTISVAANHGFNEGDELWYYKDRRNKGLVKVAGIGGTEILDGTSVTVLTVDPAPKRDQDSEEGKPVGKISSTFDVINYGGNAAELDSNAPKLKHNDKVLFVHNSETSREKTVDQAGENNQLILTDEDSGLNAEFRAVPIRKTPYMSIPLALLSVFGIVLCLGVIHGLLITRLKMQPFVVTLCGLLIYRGLSRWLTNDQTVGFIEYQETLGKVATGRWETGIQFMPVKVDPAGDASSWKLVWDSAEGAQMFGIPYSFFIFLGVIFTAIIFLNLTVWGRHLQAVGRNEEAARYSGISTHRITTLAYVLCAVLTGLGGVMFAIDSNSIAPSSFGNFFELYAIAAAVLGGCSLRGGEGSILGVVVGTALMQTLYNSIVLLKIPDELEFTIIGAVILFGVAGDELTRMLAAKFRSKEA